MSLPRLLIHQDLSPSDIRNAYISSIGALVGIILLSSILIYMSRQFYAQFIRNGAQNRSHGTKLAYEGLLLFLISSIILCIFYAFLRSNVITRISLSDFTLFQCASSFFASMLFLSIARFSMYWLLLHKLKLSYSYFMDSQVQNPSNRIYWIFYVSMTIATATALTLRIYILFNSDFILKYNQQSGIIVCKTHPHGDFDSILYVFATICGCIEFLMTVVILTLYGKRLKSIGKSMVEAYCKYQSELYPDNEIKPDSNEITVHLVIAVHTEFESDHPDEIGMIIKAYNIMKRQLILSIMMMMFSCIHWAFVGISGSVAVTVSLDITSCAIFLSFMFDALDIPWNGCIKYGCCRVFYRANYKMPRLEMSVLSETYDDDEQDSFM